MIIVNHLQDIFDIENKVLELDSHYYDANYGYGFSFSSS